MRKADDKSGDFDVHGGKNTYTTFKFVYSAKEFDDLNQLMEYNTSLHKQVHKEGVVLKY